MQKFYRRNVLGALGTASLFTMFPLSYSIRGRAEPMNSRKIDISEYDRMLLPREHGQLVKMTSSVQRRYPSREHCMQMAAFFNDEKGLLVIANDPEGGTADWYIRPKSHLRIDFFETNPDVQVVEVEPTVEAAAAVYKAWAVQQSWIQNRRRNAPRLDFVSVASSSSIAVEKKHLEQVFNSLNGNIGVWLTQWRRYPYDQKYPDYSPKEPMPFRGILSYIVEQNGIAFPHVNALLWDDNLISFREQGERLAIRSTLNQKVSYNQKLHYLKYACPASSVWREHVVSARNSLADRDGNISGGVYLDMLAAIAPMSCVSSGHGHEPGDFGAWRRGVRELFKGIEGLIITEGCAEIYIDLFDYPLMHLYTNEPDTVGLWNLVYGDYVQPLGWRLPTGVEPSQFQRIVQRSRSMGLTSLASPWMIPEPESALLARNLLDAFSRPEPPALINTDPQ